MADYYNAHLKLLSDSKIITKTKLESGMVVKLKYKDTEGVMNKYIIFVLNPKWPKTGNSKLHCISLSHMRVDKFRLLAKTYPEVLSENNVTKKLDIPILDIGDEHRKFYLKEVKNNVKLDLLNAYRTFTLKQVVNMYAVNYNWGTYDRIAPAVTRKREEKRQIIENENKLRNSNT